MLEILIFIMCLKNFEKKKNIRILQILLPKQPSIWSPEKSRFVNLILMMYQNISRHRFISADMNPYQSWPRRHFVALYYDFETAWKNINRISIGWYFQNCSEHINWLRKKNSFLFHLNCRLCLVGEFSKRILNLS